MNEIDYASTLCSRLCHDLLSPVGALNNGLELLADETDPAMREQVIELLGDSARATANKLKFFRLAFGAAGGYGQTVDTHEARSALEGLLGEEKRIAMDWMVADEKLPKDAVKLLLNLAMIAGDALVRGGQLAVGAEHGDSLELVIRAEGPRIILDEGIKTVLASGADGMTIESRTAAAYLAYALADGLGGRIQISDSDGVLMIGAQLSG